jgi:hypothetical protein
MLTLECGGQSGRNTYFSITKRKHTIELTVNPKNGLTKILDYFVFMADFFVFSGIFTVNFACVFKMLL